MIALLQGTVERRGEGFLVVLCGGIGYKIFVPDALSHASGASVVLHIHEVIREDGHELFGFLELERLELFERLIGISGIGPRGAQKIVAAGPLARVRSGIQQGDLAFFTAIPGVGKKTAQKIILELKGVLAEEETVAGMDEDAVQALVGLGYQRKEAVDALAHTEGVSTEARVRGALKQLSRH